MLLSHSHRKPLVATAAICAAIAFPVSPAAASSGGAPLADTPVATTPPPPAALLDTSGALPTLDIGPIVVKSEIQRPVKRRVTVKRFKPWATPSKAQVGRIIAVESARWGAPAWRLHCRISGESEYRWGIVNPLGYAGLGQFGSETFSRGMRSIGSRTVEMVRVSKVKRWIVRRDELSDGTVSRKKLRQINVERITKYVGVIPRHPNRTHGWAQVRLMARAMVGLGEVHDREWEVRC